MINTNFSRFKSDGAIKLTKSFKRLPFRKVRHSLSDWRKSKFKSMSKSTIPEVIETAGTGTGFVIVGTSIAMIAGSTATVVIAFGGPQMAITLGLISLAGMIKGAYSNRESAHQKLQPYIWSLIDDEPPTINIGASHDDLNKAADAATYLMKKARSQFSQMGTKLEQPQRLFKESWKEYEMAIRILTVKHGDTWLGDLNMREWENTNNKDRHAQMALYFQQCEEAMEEATKLWANAHSPGHPVFEFMRRLVHIGNYLQCAGIIEHAIFAKLGRPIERDSVDVFASWPQAVRLRKRLLTISNKIDEANANFVRLQFFMERNGMQIYQK